MDLVVDIALARKRLAEENRLIESEVDRIIPLPRHFAKGGHDPFLETIFIDQDFLSWSKFADTILKPNFSNLFYNSPELKRLLNVREASEDPEDVTLFSLAEALNGKFLIDFLRPFRLEFKNLDRALMEVNYRLREKSQVSHCTPENFYETVMVLCHFH